MGKFAILNDLPGSRDKITAELVADEDGHLRLRINGSLILYITEEGVINILSSDVDENPKSPYSFFICHHILDKDA